MEEIKKLYSQHEQDVFPQGMRGVVVAGEELVLLDADMAGCISTYINSNGQLDSKKTMILQNLVATMDNVILELPESAKPHFQRLKRIGDLVLKELHR